MQRIFQSAKRLISVGLVTLLLVVSTVTISPAPAMADNGSSRSIPQLGGEAWAFATRLVTGVSISSLDLVKHSGLIKLLSNQNLLASAQLVSNLTSGKFCSAYIDFSEGTDRVAWAAIQEGANSVFAIASAISSASAAGAGSLSGYAGIASVVSHLGLGSVTTTLAGLLGSNVAGAAATSVVTAAVGGPVVMGALLAGGTAAGVYGTYELSKFSAEKFKDWAGTYCLSANQT